MTKVTKLPAGYYDPRDHVLVHKKHLETLQARAAARSFPPSTAKLLEALRYIADYPLVSMPYDGDQWVRVADANALRTTAKKALGLEDQE